MKIKPIASLLSLAWLVAGGWGCSGSQVGPSWDKGPDGAVKSRNASPNRVSLSKGGEAWDSESAVPASYVRFFAADGVSAEALGPKSRVFEIPWLNGTVAKVASDEDTTFSVAKLTLPDGTLIEGMSLTTSASAVVKAQNEVWDRLAQIVLNRDSQAATVLLKEAETQADVAKALGSAGLELLTKVITGGL